MAAFCPIMQYHAESKAEFNQDRTPWNIAERTGDMRVIELYRHYAQLRMNLLPYIYNEALKSSNTGIPIMRALFMEYPKDINCAGIEDEYMFGDDLLVCPVISEGSVKREVYLPEGKWMDFYDKRIYEGGRKIEVDAPIDMIPVYVKQNSIIAFNLNENYMVPGKVSVGLDEYDNLCFMLYGDTAENYVFKDDVGNCIYIDIKNKEDINICVKNNDVPVNIIIKEPFKRVKVNNESIGNIVKINGGLAVIKVSEVEVYE
jgi:alpha-glucosidase (family GH31 glycosyl hydrolase)